MMRYKLLVLDIDGTVTNSKKEVTEKTKKAIIELKEEFPWPLLPGVRLRGCTRWQKPWNWTVSAVIFCL